MQVLTISAFSELRESQIFVSVRRIKKSDANTWQDITGYLLGVNRQFDGFTFAKGKKIKKETRLFCPLDNKGNKRNCWAVIRYTQYHDRRSRFKRLLAQTILWGDSWFVIMYSIVADHCFLLVALLEKGCYYVLDCGWSLLLTCWRRALLNWLSKEFVVCYFLEKALLFAPSRVLSRVLNF